MSVTGLDGYVWPYAAVTASNSAASSPSFGIPPPPPADNINFPPCETSLLDASRNDLVAGVAGAGTMGRGIAQVLAQCGARTLLFDAQAGAAQKGKSAIGDALGKLAEKGRLKAAEVDATLGRIEVIDRLERFSA